MSRCPQCLHAGELVALQKNNKLQLQQAWSPCNHSDGAVPWLQTGDRTHTMKPFPERYGALGDQPEVEETYEPRLADTPSARVRDTSKPGSAWACLRGPRAPAAAAQAGILPVSFSHARASVQAVPGLCRGSETRSAPRRSASASRRRSPQEAARCASCATATTSRTRRW